jgi:hypothetical protein
VCSFGPPDPIRLFSLDRFLWFKFSIALSRPVAAL